MNPFRELAASFSGWSEIVAGKPEAERHFVLDRRGLVVAIGWFVLAILLAAAARSVTGFPSLVQVVLGLIAELVTLALMGVAIQQCFRRMRVAAEVDRLLVPATYALAYMFVVSIPLQLIGAGLGLIALGLVAAMIARGAQVLCGLKAGPALAVAGVCLLVLVVVPAGLYIVLSLFPSA